MVNEWWINEGLKKETQGSGQQEDQEGMNEGLKKDDHGWMRYEWRMNEG